MEESDVSYSLETEQQFWEELHDIISVDCGNDNGLIDNTLRSFLHFTTNFKDEYLQSEYDMAHCASRLLNSPLYISNKGYVNLQLVYSLLQEEDGKTIHVIANLLLFGGRQDETVFEVMNDEDCFTRLLDLIKTHTGDEGLGVDRTMHRLFLELLYEMARVHRLSLSNLAEVDDEFIMHLLQIIETLSDDVDDPYHYPVIRVLLVLNEQYMVASTSPPAPGDTITQPPTNRVIKILSIRGSAYMTFGENLILLLNRETETSLQLLILKLLYLLFTTTLTHEYFYTNDLRVLLDVIIRNLLDLPFELVALRHTYLRVLYPLLANTQLSQPPFYKRDEIIRTLSVLGGAGNSHFETADDTTLRLVERVAQVSWLRPTPEESPEEPEIKDNEVARRLLGISLGPSKSDSQTSVLDVVAVSAEPGVKTPSRKDQHGHEDEEEKMYKLKHTDSMLSEADSVISSYNGGGVSLDALSDDQHPTNSNIPDEPHHKTTIQEALAAVSESLPPLSLPAPPTLPLPPPSPSKDLKQKRIPPKPPVPRLSTKKSMNLAAAAREQERKMPPKAPPPRRRAKFLSTTGSEGG